MRSGLSNDRASFASGSWHGTAPVGITPASVIRPECESIVKDRWHPGELYPRVGFIVTNLSRPAERVIAFYNQRGIFYVMRAGCPWPALLPSDLPPDGARSSIAERRVRQVGAPGSPGSPEKCYSAPPNAVVLDHPDRREDGRQSKANCTCFHGRSRADRSVGRRGQPLALRAAASGIMTGELPSARASRRPSAELAGGPFRKG